MCICDANDEACNGPSKVASQARKARQRAQQDLAIHCEQARRHQLTNKTHVVWYTQCLTNTLKENSQALGLESERTLQCTMRLDTSTKLMRNAPQQQCIKTATCILTFHIICHIYINLKNYFSIIYKTRSLCEALKCTECIHI